MISVYLTFPGNAAEEAHYYAQVFDAPAPDILTPARMSEQDRSDMGPVPENFTVHASVATFGGDLMLSDAFPGQIPRPGDMANVTFSHTDQERIRQVFDRLAKDGAVDMPLGPAFFSPLFGGLRDKYGISWLIMADEQA